MPTLSQIECRVIATLIEKSLTTPQNYPLSLNALTNGCNQKSAREPISDYSENEVLETVKGLKPKSMAVEFFGAGARVSKWEEAFKVHLELTDSQVAILAELMLRGPQTEGELRQRVSRMAGIGDQGALAQLLEGLSAREAPLVRRLSAPGRARGVIWAHTLYPEGEEPSADESPTATSTRRAGLEERLVQLEARIEALERRLADDASAV